MSVPIIYFLQRFMDNILLNKFNDLDKLAYYKNRCAASNFLSLDEQSTLLNQRYLSSVSLDGGFESSQRRIAVFVPFGFEYNICDFVSYIKISPVNNKFSDDLSHRDFLGAIMSLGIKREMIGDILVSNNTAYAVVISKIGQYIVDELKSVKHTSIKCCITEEIPDDISVNTEDRELIVSSLRLDVIICAVYNLSRNEAKYLFEGDKVFINGKIISSPSAEPDVSDIISLRGYGRFVFGGELRKTKKNRFVIKVSVYK